MLKDSQLNISRSKDPQNQFKSAVEPLKNSKVVHKRKPKSKLSYLKSMMGSNQEKICNQYEYQLEADPFKRRDILARSVTKLHSPSYQYGDDIAVKSRDILSRYTQNNAYNSPIQGKNRDKVDHSEEPQRLSSTYKKAVGQQNTVPEINMKETFNLKPLKQLQNAQNQKRKIKHRKRNKLNLNYSQLQNYQREQVKQLQRIQNMLFQVKGEIEKNRSMIQRSFEELSYLNRRQMAQQRSTEKKPFVKQQTQVSQKLKLLKNSIASLHVSPKKPEVQYLMAKNGKNNSNLCFQSSL